MLEAYVSAWNRHDFAAFDKLLTADAIHEDIAQGFRGQGPAQIKDFMRAMIEGQPDLDWRVTAVVEAGPLVAAEWTWTSTYTGDSPIGPVVRKRISGRGASIAVIENGRIKRFSDYYDMASFFPKLPADSAPSKSAAKNDEAIPAPQMEKLIHALAGEWFTEETYEPSDLVPKGGTGHSRDSYRVGPARSSLIEEYHSDGAAGKSWGIGIIWWDAEAHGFHFAWCDSYTLDRGCRVSSQLGEWDGNDYVETDEHEVAGKRVFEKEVWSDFNPNSFSQTLYVGEASDKLVRFVTIKAKRVIKQQR